MQLQYVVMVVMSFKRKSLLEIHTDLLMIPHMTCGICFKIIWEGVGRGVLIKQDWPQIWVMDKCGESHYTIISNCICA